ADLWECTRELGAELLLLTRRPPNRETACQMLNAEITSGRAMTKFREMVAAQGGNLDRLPPLADAHEIAAERGGYVGGVKTQRLGISIIELGGGRKVMTDSLDHSVGLEMLARIGDRVDTGQRLIRVFAPPEKFTHLRDMIAGCVTLAEGPMPASPLIVERIES